MLQCSESGSASIWLFKIHIGNADSDTDSEALKLCKNNEHVFTPTLIMFRNYYTVYLETIFITLTY
jgi:hypothetical protein